MNIQLQKDVENLKTEAVALEIFNLDLRCFGLKQGLPTAYPGTYFKYH